MDERLRLVAKLLDGEKMAAVCREFGISRETGYKIFGRYKTLALRGYKIEVAPLIGTPTDCPSWLKKPYSVSSRILRPGVHKSGIQLSKLFP
jgi:hypothetical protein